MPRQGRHPLKVTGLSLEQPPLHPLTVTTITHIPELTGYWEDSLNVLKLFFASLFDNTPEPFDLMVLDNGSCVEVRDYLLELKAAGRIQFLVFSSTNLRKLAGLDYLLRAASGELVAYADSDVYFLPGWLEESLRVLQAFPQAGMISALPTADKSGVFVRSTVAGARADPTLALEEGGELIPSAFLRAHRLSLGRSETEYFSHGRNDVRLSRNGVSAYVGAQDFQFVTTRAAVQAALPLRLEDPTCAYDPIYSPVFEEKLDAAGFWRLSTCRYLVHHMGNHVPDLAAELHGIVPEEQLNQHNKPEQASRHAVTKRSVWQMRPVRGLLKKLYTWSYRKLFEK